MTKDIDLDALEPTISIGIDQCVDGSFVAALIVSGLKSEQQANAVANHMQRLFCGDEIKERQ